MAEYIEREALLRELRKSRESHAETSKDFCLLIRCENIVREQLAADVMPVRYGEWADRYGGRFDNPLIECSVCGNIALYRFGVDCLRSNRFAQFRSNYCPHCGAYMGGTENA